jgi:hypothetical protein
MDPITTAIVATLTSGFDGDATPVERKAKIAAYEALIAELEKKFGLQSEIVNAIEGLEANPDSIGRKEVLKEEVAAAKADRDPDILQAAEVLLDQIRTQLDGEQHIQNAVGGYIVHADQGIWRWLQPIRNSSLSRDMKTKRGGTKHIKKWFVCIANHKLIYIGLLINVLFYISASQTKWFDYFFSGSALHLCCKGLDFYQIPNGAYAYLHGGSLSGVVPHGVKAYWIGHPLNSYNVYHPLFTLLVGSFLILFESTQSFYIWMCLKFIITLWMVIYFYKNFKGSKQLDFAIFFILINFTQYLEIEISQYQFVVNFFIFLMLINFAKNRNTALNGIWYFMSLIAKPVGLLWLPILFLKRKYKTMFIGLILFIILTVIFLLNNTGNYYTFYLMYHFFHPDKSGPIQIITLDAFLRYSTPIPEFVLGVLKIVCFIFIVCLSSFKRISLLKAIYLSIVYYLLFYDRVYEYQYTTLIPILAVCLVVCEEFQRRLSKILITIIGLPSIFFILHFFKIGFIQDPVLGPDPTAFGWQLIVLNRILPVIILTLFLLVPDIKLMYKDLQVVLRAIRKINKNLEIFE